MSKSLNRVELIGRLGADPEGRYTGNGKAFTTLRLATSESWKDASGERQERTEWHSVVLWDKAAEIANQYLHKGSLVRIEGRIQTRSWDDANGEKKYKTEIISSEVMILDSKRDGAPAPEQAKEEINWEEKRPLPAKVAAAPAVKAYAGVEPVDVPEVRSAPRPQPPKGKYMEEEDLPF